MTIKRKMSDLLDNTKVEKVTPHDLSNEIPIFLSLPSPKFINPFQDDGIDTVVFNSPDRSHLKWNLNIMYKEINDSVTNTLSKQRSNEAIVVDMDSYIIELLLDIYDEKV